jgi:pyruvate dehydrogenase (quinone)
MADPTTADVIMDTLLEWGVDTVFGMPGDGNNGLMEALRTRADRIRFVQVRHEEAAALAACGHAKFTGRLGVCLATSGPGGIHLLNGLYDAKLDGQPVLALTGLQYHDLIGTATQQDVELDRLYMDVALYNARVMGPAHAGPVTNLACRAALANRGVAHITVPVDVQSQPVSPAPASGRNVPGHSVDVFARSARLPDEDDLKRAAKVLSAGRRIVIMAGRGALNAGVTLEALAERLSAVIVKPLLGKAAVPDDSPYTTGGVGLLGTAPSQEAIEGCDTLLIVGSSFPYIEYYPKPGQARGVQIDLDPQRLGLRYPVEVGLVGDSRRTLERLLELVEPNNDRAFLETAQEGMRAWWSLMEERGTRQDSPMKPQVVAWELGRRLRDHAIVACDSGTITTWWARQMPVKRGQMHSVSGNLATMACALPYAIAAQLAHPDRQVVAFIGDGGMAMLMAELATAVKYQLPIRVVVINNQSLGQIKWEQLVFLGNPEYGCELQPIDFAAVARGFGAAGYTITEAAECGAVLDRALAEPGPVVIDAKVDPHEPPMPPKATVAQAQKLATAFARGTPARERIALTIASDTVRELV